MRRSKKKNSLARLIDLNWGRHPVLIKLSVLLILIFLFIYCSVPPTTPNSKGIEPIEVKKNGRKILLYENSHALLIGVCQYEYWSDLKSVPMEMKLLEASLKKHGFKIETSFNPTGDELRKTVKDFIDRYGFEKNNRLLIFFSGHGYNRKDEEKGYIVPSDAMDPLVDEINFARKAIEMEQILTWARRIEAKHALFVFDSCFSGTIFKTRGLPVPAYISYATGKPVRQFITSGSAGETVPQESYFVECFINGIEGEADYDNDGYITATELGIYLRRKIMQYSSGQTPQYGKISDPNLNEGDFVFIGKKAIGPPKPPPPDNLTFGPIEGVDIKGKTLIAFDAKGKERRKTFDSLINFHQLADIDQDGKKDVLIGFECTGEEHSRVIAFDAKMDELSEKWNYVNKPDFPYSRASGFGGKFRVTDLKVFNFQSRNIIIILFTDCPWYPSVLIVLNSSGEKLKEFWHPGFMYQVERINNVFTIRAVNNDLQHLSSFKNFNKNLSVIFGLKYEHIYGEAPPYFGRLEKNINFEWYYVLAEQEDFYSITVLKREIFASTICGALFFFNEKGVSRMEYTSEYSCKHTPRLIKLR